MVSTPVQYLYSNTSALNNIVMVLKENVDVHDTLIWFCCINLKEDDKRKGKAQRKYIFLEPQKAHPTNEFILVL